MEDFDANPEKKKGLCCGCFKPTDAKAGDAGSFDSTSLTAAATTNAASNEHVAALRFFFTLVVLTVHHFGIGMDNSDPLAPYNSNVELINTIVHRSPSRP